MAGINLIRKTINDRLRLRRLAQKNELVARAIRRVRQEHLSYLDLPALCDLAEVILENESKQIEGMIVEAGCALGGSAMVIASAKRRSRPFFVYDVFGLIPPPCEKDGADVHQRYSLIASGNAAGIDGQRYYGYERKLYEQVVQTFFDFSLDMASNNVHLVKGLYRESMHINSVVALAHIDCDWYESVFTCLEQVAPNLAPGGTIIVDDYFVWSGCRKAVDDYFGSAGAQSYRFIAKSRLHIVRD
jgi:hypothetical protein